VARRLALALTLCVCAGAFAGPAAAAGPTIVVGDSLAVGTRPYLPRLLPDRPLVWNVANGRTTPQGMRALRGTLRLAQPAAVVVSLGSNDGPSGRRFADRIARTLRLIPRSACVVWPTIVRPPRKGDATELNRALRDAARRDARLLLVDWVGAVRSGRVILPDGLHPDPAGYAERSRMVASVIERRCPATGLAVVPPAPGGVAAPV
jgi:lysophospholipase L1-like esterase